MPDMPTDNVAALIGAGGSTAAPPTGPVPMQGAPINLPHPAMRPQAPPEPPPGEIAPPQDPPTLANENSPVIPPGAARDFYSKHNRLPSVHELRAIKALPVITQQLGGRRPTKKELEAFLEARTENRVAPDAGLVDENGMSVA